MRNDAHGSSGSEVASYTQIHRSADGTKLYFLENFFSPSPIFLYNATADTFGPNVNTHASTGLAAVNRDGTLLCTSVFGRALLDRSSDFHYLRSFGSANSGVAFDALTNTLYAVAGATNQIIAYDTTTFVERFRLNIGESVGALQFGEGTLVASPDGIHLALETSSGVRLFDVRTGTPSAGSPTFGTPRDVVFDHLGQNLYVTTAEGLVATA